VLGGGWRCRKVSHRARIVFQHDGHGGDRPGRRRSRRPRRTAGEPRANWS
jgi:hypothetical protein